MTEEQNDELSFLQDQNQTLTNEIFELQKQLHALKLVETTKFNHIFFTQVDATGQPEEIAFVNITIPEAMQSVSSHFKNSTIVSITAIRPKTMEIQMIIL